MALWSMLDLGHLRDYLPSLSIASFFTASRLSLTGGPLLCKHCEVVGHILDHQPGGLGHLLAVSTVCYDCQKLRHPRLKLKLYSSMLLLSDLPISMVKIVERKIIRALMEGQNIYNQGYLLLGQVSTIDEELHLSFVVYLSFGFSEVPPV